MSHGIDWVPSKLYTTHKQLVFVLSCKDDINIISTTCQKHSNQANMFYRRCSVVRRRSSAQEYKYHVNFSQNSNTFTIIENLQNSVHSTYFYSYLIDMRSGILRILFLIAPLAYATVIPDAAAQEDLVIAREDLKAAEGLSAAAACKCKKVSNAGLYCGFCKTTGGVGPGNEYFNTVPYDNVAWCNTSGGCDDYGYSSHCAAREARGCKGLNAW
jgi:hypothetical protein